MYCPALLRRVGLGSFFFSFLFFHADAQCNVASDISVHGVASQAAVSVSGMSSQVPASLTTVYHVAATVHVIPSQVTVSTVHASPREGCCWLPCWVSCSCGMGFPSSCLVYCLLFLPWFGGPLPVGRLWGECSPAFAPNL